MDDKQYIVVANEDDGTASAINSIIYEYSFVTKQFVPYQTIATRGGYDWEAFQMNGQQYLAVANNFDGTLREINSAIYDVTGFVSFAAPQGDHSIVRTCWKCPICGSIARMQFPWLQCGRHATSEIPTLYP